MAANAWLASVSRAALGQVLRKPPAGRTFRFGWAPSSPRAAPAEEVSFVSERFTGAIAARASDAELPAHLAAGRESVFGVDDPIVAAGVGRGRESVRFSARDWREISHAGSAMDDAEPDRLDAFDSDEPAGGLAGFAGRARIGVPDWAAAARGHCFRRDATDRPAHAVVECLSSPKRSLPDPGGGGRMRRPLSLSGPPATGKSVGMLRVARELRRTHRIFVPWLLPGLSGLDPPQAGRICRMAETRGLPWTVLASTAPFPKSACTSSTGCCPTAGASSSAAPKPRSLKKMIRLMGTGAFRSTGPSLSGRGLGAEWLSGEARTP